MVVPCLFIAPTAAPAFTNVRQRLPWPFTYARINAVTRTTRSGNSHQALKKQSWKVIEKLKVLSEKRNDFWKQKAKVEKNWKAESQKEKFYLYHFFPLFYNRIAWTTWKFHFESYSTGTSEIFGKKGEVESLKWKAKQFLKVKSENQKRKKLLRS